VFADNGWYYATDFRMEFHNLEHLEYLGKPHMIVQYVECEVQENIGGLPIAQYQQRHSILFVCQTCINYAYFIPIP
jgi:hypothetical protein